MKKVSTVAAKPSKKISQQKLTVGLDLGDRNSWYCVVDEAGNRHGSLPSCSPNKFSLYSRMSRHLSFALAFEFPAGRQG